MIAKIITILFFTTLIIGVLETFLSLFWIRWYFKYGLTVLRTSIDIPSNFDSTLTNIIDTELLTNSIYFPLRIRAIGNNQYALRETMPTSLKLLQMGYPASMRGLMTIDYSKDKIILEGLANATPIAFSFLVLTISILFPHAITFLFLLSLLAMFFWFYKIQKKRFEAVFQIVSNQKTT